MDKFLRKRSLNRKGFTMMELVVVIAVLGIIMVVLMPRLTSGTDKAKELGVGKEFKDFNDAVETIFTENSRLPEATATVVPAAYSENPALYTEKSTDPVHTSFVVKFNTYIDDYFAIDVVNEGKNGESLNLTAVQAEDSTHGGHYATTAQDPFGATYGVIISRDNGLIPGIEEKVLVYSRGKSLTTDKADFLTLTIYKDGKISKCNAGFKTDTQFIVMPTKVTTMTEKVAPVPSKDAIGYTEIVAGEVVNGFNLKLTSIGGGGTEGAEGTDPYLTEGWVRGMTCANK